MKPIWPNVVELILKRLAGAPPFAGLTRFDELRAAKRSIVDRLPESLPEEVVRNELLMSEFVRRLAPELAEAMVVRLPLEEIVSRIDMATLTRRLLESIDLAGIVRESTATVGSEVVDAGRTQAMGVDSLVERIVDKMLFRREPRNLEVDGQ